MLATYPAAWLLLGLPLLSAMVVRSVPWLWRLAWAMNRLARPLGIIGLICLIAALLGAIPPPYALPLALAGGALSGYSVFSLPRTREDDDGDDWRRGDPPPDEPPPPPLTGATLDWPLFDRLREQWEHPRLTPR